MIIEFPGSTYIPVLKCRWEKVGNKHTFTHYYEWHSSTPRPARPNMRGERK
jgi:hypothetical protein